MPQHRWHPVPIALVSAAVVAVWTVALVGRAALGRWQAPLRVAGAVALAALPWFRRQLSEAEIRLDVVRKRAADEEFRLANERAQVEELRRAVEQELAQQASRIDRREQALADKLVAYREWMEFPQPVNLSPGAGVPPSEPSDRDLV